MLHNEFVKHVFYIFQELQTSVNVTENGVANGHALSQVVQSSLLPSMRFSWEISNVDSVFSNGSMAVARFNDLSKEAMLQAIKEKDLRFLSVRFRLP